MNALPCTIYVSLTGAVLALLAGMRSASAARVIALLTSITGLALTLYAARGFVPGA